MAKQAGAAGVLSATFMAVLLLCAGGGAAQKVDINSLQLKGLDVPEGLQQFLGAMMMKVQRLENENEALQNRTQVVEAELSGARAEISWLKKDRDVFQNKTRAVEKENAALRRWVAALEGIVYVLSNQTKTNSARLDQCEADTHPFVKEMERRRLQDEETLCRGPGLTAMFA
eukprot:SAG22_NODE_2310_length_2732_cov_60.443980_7_plen_171_part_01